MICKHYRAQDPGKRERKRWKRKAEDRGSQRCDPNPNMITLISRWRESWKIEAYKGISLRRKSQIRAG